MIYRRGNIYRKTRTPCCCKDICTLPFQNLFVCSFDGVDEYIDCGSFNPVGDNDKQITISFWAKGDICGPYIITKYDFGINQRAFFVGVRSGRFIFYISNDGTDNIGHRKFYKDITDYTDNVWRHFAVTFNGNLADDSAVNRRMKLYVNGNRIDDSSLDKNNDDDITTIFNSNAQVLIGARENNNVPQDFFNGNIDEISIWNKALDQYNINNIYNYNNPCNLDCHISSSSLISWWRMGEGDVFPVLKDSIGINDGNMINMEAGDLIRT